MTKTLDDLEKLLTARGYPCKRILDVCVLTQLPTKAYTSLRTGTKSIEVQLAFDDRNHCLTMDTPWAFDSRQAVHKEAMLACLLAASGKSPLVKTQLDPEEGEVRLRVDCRLGADGVQMGTRFAASLESNASEHFKQMYVDAVESDVTIVHSPVGLPGQGLRTVSGVRVHLLKQALQLAHQGLSGLGVRGARGHAFG
jgi:hypothetical protein